MIINMILLYYLILATIVCNIVISSTMYMYKPNILRRFTLPSNDYIVLFHCAIGEEFIFRILPDLLFHECYINRLLFSSVVFSLLHCLPYFSNNKTLLETLSTVQGTFVMGLLLSLYQYYITNTVYWYLLCCAVHVINNFIFVINTNKSLIYNDAHSGWICKLS